MDCVVSNLHSLRETASDNGWTWNTDISISSMNIREWSIEENIHIIAAKKTDGERLSITHATLWTKIHLCCNSSSCNNISKRLYRHNTPHCRWAAGGIITKVFKGLPFELICAQWAAVRKRTEVVETVHWRWMLFTRNVYELIWMWCSWVFEFIVQ